MPKRRKIRWLPAPEAHDYPAAESYLSLTLPPTAVRAVIRDLKRAPITHFKAKDIFRASGLSLLGISNSHVTKDQKRITKGRALSPLLLARDTANGRVIVADGYHRLCAVYSFDEDAVIPCKIADGLAAAP